MMRWLHISDLHIREQADWNNYSKEILSKCKEIGEIKFVIVTGDFHDFNEKNNFQKSQLFLKDLIDSLGLNISQDLFVIPGNHDGVSEIDGKDDCVLAAQHKPLEIHNRLQKLLGMFEDYEELVKNLIEDYPNNHPASVHIRTWGNKINLVHCNTAIGADGKSKENQILDIDGLSALKIDNNYPTILLAHNSFFDLHKEHQSRVKDFIRINNIRAYLCGDRHIESVEQITYKDNQNKQIPCVVSFKSAADKEDDYSRFGIIIGEWEKREAILKGWIWKSGEGFISDSHINDKTIDMGIAYKELTPFGNLKNNFKLPKDYSDWKIIDEKLEKQEAKDISKSMKSFLEGNTCTWALAFSNLLVKRQQLSSIVSSVKDGGIIALTGAGAEGKSTLLMQACVQLYYEGYNVLYHISHRKYSIPYNMTDGTILVVDDPDDSDFLELLTLAMNTDLTILFSVRLNEWNLFCRRNNLSSDIKRSITEIAVDNISKQYEAEEFAHCVVKYCNLEINFEKLVNIFLHNANDSGFLYAAMLLAMHEKDKLEEVAKDIIKNIRDEDEKSLSLLGYAILFEHVGINFSEEQYQHFLRLLDMKPKKAKASLELELRLNGNRRETRHPKISNLFYENIFGYDGEFNSSESDSMKYDVINSLLNLYNEKIYDNKERNFIIEDIVSSIQLINEAVNSEEMIQRLVEEFQKNSIVLNKLCYKLNNDKLRYLFGKKCYEKGEIQSSIFSIWVEASKSIYGIGDYMQENSALWICREACINQKITAPNVWQKWVELEQESRGTGDYTQENSALWICRKACINQKITAPNVWQRWAEFEKERRGTGDYTQENSALWICREACINQKIMAPHVWREWVELEQEIRGIGDYAQENSALWICREVCINQKITAPNVWQKWAELEMEKRGTGGYTKENSALWVCREACINQKIMAPNVWQRWAEFEKESRGTGDYSQENSALWICQEACINQKIMAPHVWLFWAELERKSRGRGDYARKNSALWICLEACINKKIIAPNVWLYWATLAKEYSTLEERWIPKTIYMESMKVTNCEVSISNSYARYLMEMGDFEGSRSIYRKLYNQGKNGILPSLLWIETIAENFTQENEYSVPQLLNKLIRTGLNQMSGQYGLWIYYCLLENKEEANKYYLMLDWSSDKVKMHDQASKEFLCNCKKTYKNILHQEVNV